MKKLHITFGNERYYKSIDLLEKTSLEIGKVDKFKRYTQEWLKTTDFWKKNQFILSRPRGAGYWMWKPYIILNNFSHLNDGDAVLYSDAGLSVIDNLNPLFEIAQNNPNNGKVIFRLPAHEVTAHLAKTWTKRDCFVITNCDEKKYWDADMTNGAVSVWVKNQHTIDFLNEWLRFMRDPRVVTDDPNMCGKPNFMEFKDHRHDQSVLTILSTKYGFELFRDPTQFGNMDLEKYTNSPYPQLFNHHRGQI